MEFNMGTPNHPEGGAHWSAKTLMWHKLRMALKAQPRAYGSPLPRELRNIAVPNEWDDPRLTQAVERVMDRVDSRPGYSSHIADLDRAEVSSSVDIRSSFDLSASSFALSMPTPIM